jgi:hypothetical protein
LRKKNKLKKKSGPKRKYVRKVAADRPKRKYVRKSVAAQLKSVVAAAATPSKHYRDVVLLTNGNGHTPKRRDCPTSVRFSPADKEMLAWLQNHYQTDGPTATLRRAMQKAKEVAA